jgi:RHH-type transcriptional regulator, rel operon repressor / antitoxin RelB
MNDTTTFTIRVPADIKRRLERLAKATSRTRSWLAAEAVASYVAEQEWQLAEIEEGIKDAAAGHLTLHEDVKRWLESWGTDHEQAPPTCK